MTLRLLYIRLHQTCFFEHLIEYVPNLEEMSVEFDYTMGPYTLTTLDIERSRQLNENWFNKVRKNKE